MARNRYLNKQGYRQFLVDFIEENSETSQIGVPRHTRDCPLSQYLQHLTYREWNVSALGCVPQVRTERDEDPDRLNHEFKTPRWAQRYIFALDAYTGRQPVAITAGDALYVLDEAVG